MHSVKPFPAETVIAVVANLKKPKFLGNFDLYTLAVTQKRAIFAHTTEDMINQSLKDVQKVPKSKGGSFFDKWGAEIDTNFFFTEKYKSMEPDEILLEQPDNFEIEHYGIKKIRVYEKEDNRVDNSIMSRYWYEVEFETRLGTLKYIVDIDPRPELRYGFGLKVED